MEMKQSSISGTSIVNLMAYKDGILNSKEMFWCMKDTISLSPLTLLILSMLGK